MGTARRRAGRASTRTALAVAAFACACVALPVPASATRASDTALGWGHPKRIATLAASDGETGDEFAHSLAVTSAGDVAVVGAEGAAGVHGAVYVYARTAGSWQQTAELTAPDGQIGDEFGSAVAVSRTGTTILVGASERGTQAGAAYIFAEHGGSWHEVAEVTAPDSLPYSHFGAAVALSGDGTTALVGAYLHGGGTVYAYSNASRTWRQTQELIPSDEGPYDWFGWTLALNTRGTTAVIGSPSRQGAGAVYVYHQVNGSWHQREELTASDGVAKDEFGGRVALSGSGTTLLVGAWGRDSGAGAAYMFTRGAGTWSQAAELTPSDGVASAAFGYSVALPADGSVVAVGAPYRDSATGADYVFSVSGGHWQQATEWHGSGQDFYGYTNAMPAKGATLLVGLQGQHDETGQVNLFAR